MYYIVNGFYFDELMITFDKDKAYRKFDRLTREIDESLNNLNKQEPFEVEEKEDDKDKDLEEDEIINKLSEELDPEEELDKAAELNTVKDCLIKLMENNYSKLEIDFKFTESNLYLPFGFLKETNAQQQINAVNDKRVSEILNYEALLETDNETWARIYIFKNIPNDDFDEVLNSKMRLFINIFNNPEKYADDELFDKAKEYDENMADYAPHTDEDME